MRFSELIKESIQVLKESGRLTYRALQREFGLDAETLEDLKTELIKARKVAVDEDGEILVWVGEGAAASERPAPKPVTYTPSHLAARIRSQQLAMESRGGQEGERKTITVLFADLKGSTALLEGLDPEVARTVIDPALQIMMDAVHRYEGYVAQALGDGILALFGAPLAHEDHAQRAVFAALRMQEELQRYSDSVRLKHGAPLAMRVGLNTGEVVVRSIRKDDLHTDYVPIGHSINLAARMEQMATPGSILITETTAKLVEGFFALKSLGAAEIKGVEHPLPVFEVTGVGSLRTRLQVAASRGLTRFVGRQSELQQMQHALAYAREGRGQVIGIMGEPGIGKSRLVHEFKASAHGFAVFEAYSASHGKASPYLPITEMLKGYFQIQLQDDEYARREKVLGKLLTLDRSLEEVLPYYFALFNIEDADSPLPQMDPQLRRRRTLEALKKVTLRASLGQPLLLIFEDLHWIDSETQGYLDSLVESIGSARILLLTNYRPEYRHDWGGKTYCTQLRLAPFGTVEAAEFLDILLGESADTSTANRRSTLRQWILEKTEGTPFFIEEVVQELFEQGVLQRDLHGKLLLPAQPTTRIQIPTTVQGVLAARIDRLAPAEKALLQQLAVVGREFPFSLAKTVVGTADDELHSLLSALQNKEFLYEQPAFPEVEYLFKHALTQEVAYNSLLQETRKAIHEKTALAIELAYQSEIEDHYSDLAHHFGRGDKLEKAIEYAELAGVQASQRAALHDARNYFESALELLKRIPKTATAEATELRIILILWGSLAVLKGLGAVETEQACQAARELCERVGTAADLLSALVQLRIHYAVRGDCERALEYSAEILRLAEREQAPDYFLHANVAFAVSHYYRGALQLSCDHSARVREAYDFERHRHLSIAMGADPLVLSLGHEATALWFQGYPQQALGKIEECGALANRIGQPAMQALARFFACVLRVLRRESSDAEQAAEALSEFSQERELPDWLNWAKNIYGWALEHRGQRQGLEILEQGIAAAVAVRAELMLTLYQILLAQVHLQRGAPLKAQAAVEEGLAVAHRNREMVYIADLHRLRGEVALLVAADDPASALAAETHFLESIRIAQEQQAKSWELRTTLSLARWWSAQGRAQEARERLTTVYTWFTEGFDTPDLMEARALLDNT